MAEDSVLMYRRNYTPGLTHHLMCRQAAAFHTNQDSSKHLLALDHQNALYVIHVLQMPVPQTLQLQNKVENAETIFPSRLCLALP